MLLLFMACASEPSSVSLQLPDDGVTDEAPMGLHKGLWGPMITVPGAQSMEDPERLAATGVNQVAVSRLVLLSSEALMHQTSDAELAETVAFYRERGFGVQVAVDIGYMDEQGQFNGSVSELMAGSPTFMETLLEVVADSARIAEEGGANSFVPLNEPDRVLGRTAELWAEPLAEAGRAEFSGDLVWKESRETSMTVEGYDVLSFALVPDASHLNPEDLRRNVARQVDTVWAQADASDIDAVMVGEFGLWGDDFSRWSPELQASFYQIVFEEALGVDGFYVFDGPQGYDPALAGSPGEEVVADWYLDRL